MSSKGERDRKDKERARHRRKTIANVVPHRWAEIHLVFSAPCSVESVECRQRVDGWR